MKTITTETEYQVQGHYSGQWEEVTAERTYREGRARLHEYRENEPGTPFRLRSVAVPVPTTPVWLHFASSRGDCLHTVRSKRIGAYALVAGRWRKIVDGAVDTLHDGERCRVADMRREDFTSDREAQAAGVKL